MIKKCKVCGAEFEASKCNQIYCSRECRKIGNRQQVRDYYQNNRDKIREYQREYHHEYYCKNQEKIKEQQLNYYHTHKILKPKQNRICKLCGKPFKPTNNCQIYCSKECARKADNERSRQYYQKNKEKLKARYRDYYRKTNFIFKANRCCAKHGGIDNCPYEDCICE